MFFVFGLFYSSSAQIDLDSLMHERDKIKEYPIDQIRGGKYTLLKRTSPEYLDSNWVIRWGNETWYIDSIFSKEIPFAFGINHVSLFEPASQDTSKGIIGLSFEIQWSFEMPKENWEGFRKLKIILEPQSRRELFRAIYLYSEDRREKLLYDELSGNLHSTFTYYYYDLYFNGHGDAFISNVKDSCILKLDKVSGSGINRRNISTSRFSVDSVIDHKPGRYKNIHGYYVYFPRKKERRTSFTEKEMIATSEDEKVKIYNLTTVKNSIPYIHTFLEYAEDSSRLEWCIDSLLDLTYTISIYDFSIQLIQVEEGGIPEVLLSYTKKVVDGDDLVKNIMIDSIHILLSIDRRMELFRAIPKILHKEEVFRSVNNSNERLYRKPWQCAYEYDITYEDQRIIIDEQEIDCGEHERVADHEPGIYNLVDGKFVKQ